jgi:hypothetical protein
MSEMYQAASGDRSLGFCRSGFWLHTVATILQRDRLAARASPT